MTFAYRFPTFFHLFVQYSILKVAADYKSQNSILCTPKFLSVGRIIPAI